MLEDFRANVLKSVDSEYGEDAGGGGGGGGGMPGCKWPFTGD